MTVRANQVLTRVHELIYTVSGEWDELLIHENFWPIAVDRILQIPIHHQETEDYITWHLTKSGVFTVRSAYRMLADTKRRREDWLEGRAGSSNYEAEARSWKSLWSAKVPGKIRNFLWRLAKHSIPTEDVRLHRKMATTDRCQICGAQDSWRHSLLECTMAQCVWALTDDDISSLLQATT